MLLEKVPPPILALIGRARDGDRDAFGRLVERHYDFIHRVAWRWAGNRADAEDIAQDVCVGLARRSAPIVAAAPSRPGSTRMTLNAARDLRRKSARDSVKMEAFGVHALVSGGEAYEPAADDPAERLWAVVRTLPDKQREAVLLVYGEGMSHADAADVMGCAEATVSWHIHEAKKRLKQIMRSAGED